MGANKLKNVQQNEGEEGRLTAVQEAVLVGLLAGNTQRDAAAVADVTEQTVSRWVRTDPAFIAAYNRGRATVYDASINAIMVIRMAAVEALAEMVTDTDPGNQYIRLQAARLILSIDQPAIGPTEPADVENQLKAAERDREIEDIINRRH